MLRVHPTYSPNGYCVEAAKAAGQGGLLDMNETQTVRQVRRRRRVRIASDVTAGSTRRRTSTKHHGNRQHRRSRTRTRKRAYFWIFCAAVGGLGFILAGTAALAATRIGSDLHAARAELTAARQGVAGLLGRTGEKAAVRQQLGQAGVHIRHARTEFDRSPGLHIASVLPWVGPNVRVADDAITIADAMVRAADRATDGISQTRSIADGRYVAVADGRIQIADLAALNAALDDASKILDSVRDPLTRLENPPAGPLQTQARDAASDFAIAADQVRSAQAGLALLPAALGFEGPRTYLVAGRNLAELRADGGMVLAAATVTFDAGAVTFTQPVSVGQLTIAQNPPNLDMPDWYRYAFDRFKASRMFQNANLTAHFPTAAAVMAQTYEASTAQHLDGVIAVDAVALQHALAVTGPVQVRDRTVDAGSVVSYATNEIYQLEATGEARNDEIVVETTEATVHKLLAGGWDEIALTRALGAAVPESHLQIWMADPAQQRFVSELGATGDYTPSGGDYLRVAVQNFGANKLDYFLERSVRHEVTLRQDGSAFAKTAVTLRNPAVEGQPQYVVGPAGNFPNFVAGDHQAYVGIYVPKGSLLRSWETSGSQPNSFEEGSRLSYSSLARVNAGTSETVEFAYEIPHFSDDWAEQRAFEIVLQPQGTVRPDEVTLVVHPPGGWKIEGRATYKRTLRLERTKTLHLQVTADSGP